MSLAHQHVADAARALVAHRARPEQVPLVRGQPRAGPLVAVEPDRVAAAARRARSARAAPPARRPRSRSRSARAPSPSSSNIRAIMPLRADHVALDLHERDRRGERLPGVVGDAVRRVLPALRLEPVRRAAAVLDQAVAVEVAVAVDPVERRDRPARAARGTGRGCRTSRRTGRAGTGTAAWRRRCRSSGRTASRRASRARRRAARGAPCRAPRRARRRTRGRAAPRAAAASPPRRPGTNESVSKAVIRLSRPNSVANQGTPGGVVGLPVELGAEQLEVVERALEDAVEELVVRADARAVLERRARRNRHARARRRPARRPRSRASRSIAPRGARSRSKHERAAVRRARLRARVDAVVRRTPSRPTVEKPSGPALGRLALVPRHDAAQLEHRQEVGAEARPRAAAESGRGDSCARRSSDAARPSPSARRSIRIRSLSAGSRSPARRARGRGW